MRYFMTLTNTVRLFLTANLLKHCFLRQGLFVMGDMGSKTIMPDKEDALPGRDTKMVVNDRHAVNGNPTVPPFPDEMKLAMFGMGCFWGVERKFWQQPGVFSTQVGYAGGFTKNPLYKEVCTGQTGHNEVVRVVFNPGQISYADLLQVFWENHNPTQGMRQGNDVGTQYRSGIYYYDDEQKELAFRSRDRFQDELTKKGYPKVTTEILPAPEFYYAEDYHQQYLHKNPEGYCGLKGVGLSCPVGLFDKDKTKEEL